ncbi:MAG: hypothetical protein PHI59_03870, partial [Candidatus Omnitrophica bacterium]|nr:hypothetical protein [Candidatus Omnitrophota bacterium]
TKYTDREGNIYEYTYNYNLKVATQKDPDNNYTIFGYYWATTHITNRDNELWMYTVDTTSLLQREVKDNLGAATAYYWTPDTENPGQYIPELEHAEDQYGRKNYYLYDERGNREEIKDPTLNVTKFRYSTDYNQIEWKKDACGNETTYTYDNGKLTEVHEPLGKTTLMEYYGDGKLKKMTDANDNITEYGYDANGYTNKIKYHTETGIIEKNFVYDTVGNLLSETDEEGNVTNYIYDENNNLKEVRDGSDNLLTSYTYDKNDNIKTITDALGHTVHHQYDWTGNLVKKTEYDEDNVPHSIEYTYDNVDYLHLGKSRLTRVQDQENNITAYQYLNEWHEDVYGVLKTAIDAEGRQTKYKYDMVGNLICIEDSAAKKTKYQYDDNDRIWIITYPDNTSEEFHYTPVGNLDNKHDRMWRTTIFEYDELNRLRFKRYPAGSVEYQYDKLNLRHAITADGATDLNYDGLNRLKDITSPGDKTVAYEYYNNGLRKKLIYPDNTYVTYHYDNLKRLTDIKDSSGGVIAHYDYDGLSSRRSGLTYANGASIEYAYDLLNRIKSMKNEASSGDIFTQFDYTYDKVGNRETMTTTEGSYQYAYDKTYQLKDVTYPDMRTARYQYDNMGNRQYVDERGEHWDYTLKTNGLNQYDTLRKTRHNIDVDGTIRGNNPAVTVNNVDGTVSGEGFIAEDVTLNTGSNTVLARATDPSGTLSDSADINLDTRNVKTFTYDSNGSITTVTFMDKTVTYGYDYENRLISVECGPSTVIYKCDYLGRRIRKEITVDGGLSIVDYIYDGDNIIAEYDSSNSLATRYVYGPNIDEPIRLENASGICYYHFDALGSVTDLSNGSGQQIEHYTYSPFGKTKIYDPATGMKRDDSIVGNVYRFTARQWDPESSLYYYRARYYDPGLGRFLQTDPVGYEGGNLNLYGYCSNNPINRTDPSGKCDWGVKLAGVLDRLISNAEEFYTKSPDLWVFNGIVSTIADMGRGFSDLFRLGTGFAAAEQYFNQGDYWMGAAEICRDISRGASIAALSAEAAYSTRPFHQYYPEGNTGYTSPYMTRGNGWSPPYKTGQEAVSNLSLPPHNPGTAVRAVDTSFRRVTGGGRVEPKFGQPGGGIQYQMR